MRCHLVLDRHSQGFETLWAWKVCLDDKIVTVTSSWLKAACLFLVFSYALDIAEMLKNIYHPRSCFQRGQDLLFPPWDRSMEQEHLLSSQDGEGGAAHTMSERLAFPGSTLLEFRIPCPRPQVPSPWLSPACRPSVRLWTPFHFQFPVFKGLPHTPSSSFCPVGG